MSVAEQLTSFPGYPFAAEQRYLVLDYETFSRAKLKSVGAWEYSRDPSTEIICVAWRVGTRATLMDAPTRVWSPLIETGEGTFDELIALMSDPAIVIVAHNALFEQAITTNVFWKYDLGVNCPPPERWLCTAALVAALAIPRKLEQAATILRLPVQKDMAGHKLMLKLAKPRKPTKRNPATRWTDPADVARVVQYCKTDIDAEALLLLKCPPLTPTERRVWVLDQKINLRGFAVDRPLVQSVLGMIHTETARLSAETEAETQGLITSANQRDAILAWLREEGIHLPDLRKGTVQDAIDSGLVTGSAKTLLELRQAGAKTSTAKYVSFDVRSQSDGRLRDILVYHTATTGRWGGAGVQPQNFPRGTIKNTLQAAEVLKLGDLELVRLLYGEPMAVFSSCLRNMIVAPPGRVLDVADYASIEARVLFWVAGHEAGIKAFLDNRPMYEEMAARIFLRPVHAIAKDSFERFVGKEAVLGMGYMMGWERFQRAVRDKGKDITDELAQRSVETYREVNWPVVSLWDDLNNAAIAAVENMGKTFRVGPVTWYVKGSILWCKLPSGRCLAYPQPTVEWLPPPWKGDLRKTLCHWGMNQYSRRWEKQRTYGGKLTENIVQAIARDLMAAAMLRIDDTGVWDIVLSVHDELIAERDADKASIQGFVSLMEYLPPWAKGCPVKAEGWSGTRYKK
jgi:DNA polymerase